MANKVLSIDIGYSLTKVCEMDYGCKNPKIYNSFVISTPEGMLVDGLVTVNENFISALKTALETKNIKTRKIIFSISSSKIATREARIPYCKVNRIADVVRAGLNDYFPIDVSQYLFSHTILGVEGKKNTPDDDSNKNSSVAKPSGYKLLILAMPKQMMKGYELLAKSLGMEIVATDYSGNSIYQAAKEECQEGTQLVIRVDERASLLMILKNGVIVLNRTIAYGIDDAIEALTETTLLGNVENYQAALTLARRKTCILSSFSEGDKKTNEVESEKESIEVRKDKIHVTDSLKALAGGIARVIDYYNSNNSGEQIDKMYVTGLGADFSGLSGLLAKELGYKIRNLTKLTGINVEKAFREVSFGEYVTCIGAAIEPLSFYPDHIEGGSAKGKTAIDYQKIAYGVLIGCTLISIVLIVTSLVPYILEKRKKKQYESIITDLQPSYNTYLTYQQLNKDVTGMKALDGTTRNQNEKLIDLINTLERNMPSSFCLNSMNITIDGVTLDVTVATKEEVASVLSELKKIPIFTQTDITSVNELTTEIGEKQYSFTVELVYAPLAVETEEGEN